MILDGAGRHLEDGGYLLDAAVFEIMQGDSRPLLLRQSIQGLIKFLVTEGRIGGFRSGNRCNFLFFNGDGLPFPPTAEIDETIVGNSEQPRPERGKPEERAGCDIGPDQGFLGDIIGLGPVSGTKRQQEPSQGHLLHADKVDEMLPGHVLLFPILPVLLLRLDLFGKHPLSKEISDEESYSDSEEEAAG